MITGNLKQLDRLTTLHPLLLDIIDQVKNRLSQCQDVGRYQLDIEQAFFFIVECQTLPLENTRSEIHQKYLDVQIVVEGEEAFGYSESPFISIEDDQLQSKDVAFSEKIVDEQFISLKKDDFIIFPPNHPHRPMLNIGQPTTIKKAVIKVDHSMLLEQ